MTRRLVALVGVAFSTSIAFFLVASEAAPHAGPQRFKPGQPWLDAAGTPINAHGFGILDHGGLYYWYGSHKIEGRTESQKNEAGVRCYVSSDLLNWTNAGLVLAKDWPGIHPEVAGAGILDRPKVVFHEPSRRFRLYFKLYDSDPRTGAHSTAVGYVGTADAESPLGPFTYRGRFLGADSSEGSGDFALFQDVDGALYHVCVRKPDKQLMCGRLSEDGLGPAGLYSAMEGVERATEAPALFRRGGRIYLLGSGSSGWAPNAARMYVADTVTGPYQALRNPCRGVNPYNQLGPEKTFGGQSTFVLAVPGRRDAWIAMFDVWNPKEPIKAGYLWLPLRFVADQPVIQWQAEWDFSVFDNP